MNGELEHMVLARLEHVEARERKRDDAQLNLLGEVMQVKELMHELSTQFSSEMLHLHTFVREQFKAASAVNRAPKKRKAR